MATVVLDELWLHLNSDRSRYVTSWGFRAEAEDTGVEGGVFTAANGRRMVRRRASRPKTIAVTMPSVDRATIDTLESWAGLELMFRDPRSRKLFGSFFSLNIVEKSGPLLPEVSFTFELTTVSEVV